MSINEGSKIRQIQPKIEVDQENWVRTSGVKVGEVRGKG